VNEAIAKMQSVVTTAKALRKNSDE
jgi:hypothetical protein